MMKYSDYFENGGAIQPGFTQSGVTAADSLINYNDYQSVVFVIQPFNTTDAAGMPLKKSPWPMAWPETFTTAEGTPTLAVIQMPHDWDRNGVHPTFSHELGHNLGLQDQYEDSSLFNRNINARILYDWELMGWDANIPHFCLAHKLMLGWVNPNWIKTYNFASMGAAPVDETIVLSPIEQGNPTLKR